MKIINEAWEDQQRKLLRQLPKEAMPLLRKMFFSGAGIVLAELIYPDNEPTEQERIAILAAMHDEMREFVNVVKTASARRN